MAKINTGRTYSSSFVGPIRPQDKRAPQGFIGPTANRLPAQGSVLGAAIGPSGGGGAPQAGQPQGQSSQDLSQLMNQNQPQQASIDFDALIAPALQALEQTVPTLQQGFSDYQTGQEGAKQIQLASSRQNIGAQEATLGQARTEQTQQGESAIDEARRQFSEIQQGLQARYGGTTGTGRFAGELAGRQSMQNIGNIRQGITQAMQQIDDKLVQVKEIGRIAEQDITQQTEERVRQARESLNLQIADIRRQQGVLQADKARMTAESIQNYQTQVNQYKSQQQQFVQQLYVQQVNAENQLKAANQRAQQAAESFKVMNLSQGGQTTPVRVGNQGTIQDFGGQAIAPGTGSALYETGTLPNRAKTLEEQINEAFGAGA